MGRSSASDVTSRRDRGCGSDKGKLECAWEIWGFGVLYKVNPGHSGYAVSSLRKEVRDEP